MWDRAHRRKTAFLNDWLLPTDARCCDCREPVGSRLVRRLKSRARCRICSGRSRRLVLAAASARAVHDRTNEAALSARMRLGAEPNSHAPHAARQTRVRAVGPPEFLAARSSTLSEKAFCCQSREM